MKTHRIRSGDAELAAWTQGPDDAPVVVLVHGYPDTHAVWAPVAALLQARFRVISYDVRGTGESTAPGSLAGFSMDSLRCDLEAVLAALAPGRRVHLVGHDWGGIQHWESATTPGTALASFVTLSGPSLDHAGHWLRAGLQHPGALARQALHGSYVLALLSPLGSAVGRGVQLYRKNFARALLSPRVREAQVPVLQLVPEADPFVLPALAQAADPFVTKLWRRYVHGGHWVLKSHPERVARWLTEWVDFQEGGAPSMDLRRAEVHAAAPPPGPLAVITGAGSGIGRETALALAEQRGRVVIADLDLPSAQRTAELCNLLGATATAVQVDVGNASAMETFAAGVEREHGVPDLVINNAGIGMAGGVLDTTVADWERVLRVNLWGVIHGSRLFGRQMVARGQGGHIVNVASMAAFAPSRSLPAYSTSKAAVLMLTECLRAELAADGIGVSAICPGIIDTPIIERTHFAGVTEEQQALHRTAGKRLYRRRGFSPRAVALKVMDAVRRDLAVVPVSPEASVSLLLSRWVPPLMRRLARLDVTPR